MNILVRREAENVADRGTNLYVCFSWCWLHLWLDDEEAAGLMLRIHSRRWPFKRHGVFTLWANEAARRAR